MIKCSFTMIFFVLKEKENGEKKQMLETFELEKTQMKKMIEEEMTELFASEREHMATAQLEKDQLLKVSI